jgi:hypothetical protein
MSSRRPHPLAALAAANAPAREDQAARNARQAKTLAEEAELMRAAAGALEAEEELELDDVALRLEGHAGAGVSYGDALELARQQRFGRVRRP